MGSHKILVFTIPLSGHVIPLYPILNQFKDNKNVEIIVYSTEKYRKNFENVGAKYRSLVNWGSEMVEIADIGKKKVFQSLTMLQRLSYYAAKSAKQLAQDIDNEKPDLIVYDITALYVRWTLEYYNKWYDIAQKIESPSARANLEFSPKNPAPPLVCMSPSFARDFINFPNKAEALFTQQNFLTLSFIIGIILYVISHFYRCFKCGLGFRSPFKNVFPAPIPNTKFVLVTVFPELQSRAHMFDKNMYKFIGCTVDDTVTNEFSFENLESLREIFVKFNVKETKRNILKETKQHLVYVSLGSCFNNNIEVYQEILYGIKTFNLGRNKHNINLDNLKVVVSTGKVVLNKLTKMINENEYLLPSNVILVESAPQIEILKRASVFITHSGQNSVSEAVHFGVPMICIPISADQPLVSYRVADDLGIGIRLDLVEFTSEDVRMSLHRIFDDEQFYVRCDRLSKISHEYPGYANGAKLIMDLIEKNTN